MNTQWVETLKAEGLIGGVPAQAGTGAVAGHCADQVQLVDLSFLSIVDVTGVDAAAFLQGQLCNDLTKVSTTRAQITGYCTPKGRLLALPTIVGIADGFRLVLPANIKESFVKRLSMFIMRASVVITERSDWICTGVMSDSSGLTGDVGAHLGALPHASMDAATSDTQQLICWPSGSETPSAVRYMVLAGVNDQIALWNTCKSVPKAGDAVWRLADIAAGIPSVTSQTQEAFVPQMVNLQLIDALSFTKGCYPGQEIVARMQYLGKLKRHMRRFRLSPDATGKVSVPQAGDSLQAGEDAEAGIVVDAVLGADGRAMLLAVVKVSAAEATWSAQGQPLLAMDLPYDIPSLQAEQVDAG